MMGSVKLRMSAADRERLGAPAELLFNRANLDAVVSTTLAGWESQLPQSTSIYQICVLEWPKFSTLGMRGITWLAWQMAGGAPLWEDFDISTTGLRFTIVKDADADPPGDGPSVQSLEAAASAMGSA